jgi:hypothetical protein
MKSIIRISFALLAIGFTLFLLGLPAIVIAYQLLAIR